MDFGHYSIWVSSCFEARLISGEELSPRVKPS